MKSALLSRVLKSVVLSAFFVLLVLSLNIPTVRAETVKKKPYARSTTSDYSSSSSSYGSPMHAVSGLFGFYAPGWTTYTGNSSATGTPVSVNPKSSGFFGIGGDYEYLYRSDLSFGALLRYYSTGDTYGSTTDESLGLLTIGGFVKANAELNDWNPYVMTGLGIISPTYKTTTAGATTTVDISMGFGFYFGMGMLYKINSQLSVGVENLRMVAVGEKINGTPICDYMLKGRYTFGQ